MTLALQASPAPIEVPAASWGAPYLPDLSDTCKALSHDGFVVLEAAKVVDALACPAGNLLALYDSWNNLPPDLYL